MSSFYRYPLSPSSFSFFNHPPTYKSSPFCSSSLLTVASLLPFSPSPSLGSLIIAAAVHIDWWLEDYRGFATAALSCVSGSPALLHCAQYTLYRHTHTHTPRGKLQLVCRKGGDELSVSDAQLQTVTQTHDDSGSKRLRCVFNISQSSQNLNADPASRFFFFHCSF